MSTYDFKFCFALKRLQKSLEENVITVFEKTFIMSQLPKLDKL